MSLIRLPNRVARAGASAAGAALALLGGACATMAQAPGYHADDMLQARIYAPAGGHLQFAVSRPAYVAIFEVVPGVGMSMLYPASSYDAGRRFTSGSHSFLAPSFVFGRDLYSHAGYGYGRGFSMSPTHLVLVASERPLRVRGMLGMPTVLRNEVGFSTYYSLASAHSIEQLAASVVADPESTDWTYDTYVIWPSAPAGIPPAFQVFCADGSVRIVTWGRVPPDCLRRPSAPEDSTVVPPRDTADLAAPRPRERNPRGEPQAGGPTIVDRTEPRARGARPEADRSRGRGQAEGSAWTGRSREGGRPGATGGRATGAGRSGSGEVSARRPEGSGSARERTGARARERPAAGSRPSPAATRRSEPAAARPAQPAPSRQPAGEGRRSADSERSRARN
jgi:hypothetical protein